MLSYEWDFDGDGTPEETTAASTAIWVYDQHGTYQARVTVDHGTDTATAVADPVTVGNRRPAAALIVTPDTVDIGETVTLDASNSADPDDGDTIVSYAWDTDGDGTFEVAGTETTQTTRSQHPASAGCPCG